MLLLRHFSRVPYAAALCHHAPLVSLQDMCIEHVAVPSPTLRCIASRYSAALAASVCWQCGTQGTPADAFFCQQCKTIQPPAKDPNFFDVMGLGQPAYDLDKRILEARYKTLQRDLHPDKFATRDSRQQEYSAEQSSLVNRAYTTMRSPLQRALYLLQNKGVVVPEDGGTINDPALLMEVMEQREAVEETDDVGVLEDMLAANKSCEESTIQKLSGAFHSGDLDAAQSLITDLRYVTRTGEAIAKKIP